MIRTAILSVSALSVRDERWAASEAESAVAAVREVLARGPFTEIDYQVVPDEQAIIRARLRLWADDGSADLVLSLGGVGPGVRDRTPDATLEVVERQFPGIAEALRAAGSQVDPNAGLWRCAAGVRRGTMVVNLPSDPKSIRASLSAVSGQLAAAAEVISAPPPISGEPDVTAGRRGRG
jgi:molybdopterin adenylyltransferase